MKFKLKLIFSAAMIVTFTSPIFANNESAKNEPAKLTSTLKYRKDGSNYVLILQPGQKVIETQPLDSNSSCYDRIGQLEN